jgi:hypothetical protein
MAYAFTTTKLYSRYNARNFYKFYWEELTEAKTSPDMVSNILGNMNFWFSVAGSFGTGGHVRLQGSMDGTNWYNLESGSAAIDITGAGSVMVDAGQVFRYLRPLVSAGTSVDVDVTLIAMP